MTREMQSSQIVGNGLNEYSVSPRDRKLFVDNVTKAPAPDIDRANEILPIVGRSYGVLGVSSKDRKRMLQEWETKLYGGTAKEQTRASNGLQSIEQTHNALILPVNKRIR
ncbi:MAG: hypothetical protein A3D74_02620 [Candidatus Levybacteria bacterium RIFCSPHIGHO2_02_FULL_37_13]|nr:MAG: hypothetical protein A3D74_02620 [Candidatus Levybacteria bacterium RIFCSPHIGHO2_02_FULL_37_13]OGH37624.1 MAG: hypothetical protein A3B41_02145 [Candidatus Levybacteria bacterium RIFCSPLOWO2_01_FULL_37_26]